MKSKLVFYTQEFRNVGNKGFFHLFTAQGLILIVGFISQFLVAGFLDPTDIGRIKIMQTYINLSALICGLGFDTSLLKLVSESKEDNEKRSLYQTAFLATLISFCAVYLVLCLLSLLNMVSSDPVISHVFPVYVLFLLPLAIQNIQLSYYQANRKIKTMAMLQLIVKLISLLFIVIFTFLFKLKGYVTIIVLTGCFATIIFEMGIKNFRFEFSYFRINLRLVKRMWNLAGFALITNVLGMLVATLDVYLINYMISDRKEIGYYMFALTIISVYQLFPITIQQVAFPFFSEQSRYPEKWFKSYQKYNKLNHLLVLLVVVVGVLLVPILIKVVFSGKYDRSVYYFIFLSIAWMIKASNIMKGTALMGYGRFDINFVGSLITFIVTFPIVFVLIRYHGLNGAMIGVSIGAIVSYVTVFFTFAWFKRRLFEM